jgi:sigma-E factor negative regulatory protein RseA
MENAGEPDVESIMREQVPMDADESRRLMSLLADGEADAAESSRGCAAWAAGDAQVRERWHAYHLIGDVLRSEDLASPPGRDLAFVQRLSLRLDAEPVVLAPQPAPPARRRGWALPAALAAGVMALATVLVVAIGPGGGASAPTLAAAPAAPAAPVTSATPAAVAPAATAVAAAPEEEVSPGGRIVRDAQLDRYLRAHRDYAAALPGSLPGGAGRSLTTASYQR